MIKQFFTLALCLLIVSFTTAQTTKTATQYYSDGVKLQNDGKYSEAFTAFKNAIVKNSNYKEALFSAGWNCNELKKYSEAIPYLQKAKTLWPNEPKVYLELGYAYEMLKKKTDAITNYNKCISLKSDYSLAYKYLGILYYDDKDYEKSLKNITSYLDIIPNSKDDDIYFRKAVSENEMGLHDDALESITKALDLEPDKVKFNNELAYTYHKLKNDKEALKYYLKSIEADGNNVKANYWAGWCYNELGKYNEAVPYLEKALEVDDKYISAYTELGYCYYALKNYDKALNNFKKAFAIEKTPLTVYYTGLCFVGKKDKTSALKMVSELKAMNSDYQEKLQKAIDKM